jgi:hypothetical protein
MQRSSIIATVVAAGGILIAGSVASVAVINAASSSQPDSETIQLVAAGSTATASPEATAGVSAEQSVAAPAGLPTVEASTLPDIPEVTQPAAQPAAVQAAPATASKPARKPAASKGSDDDSAPTRSAEPAATVSENQARSIVLKQGDGVAIVSTSKESHQGYSTWAIRITRSNGEVLTGYVDRASGVVVDWTVNQKAPAQPTPTATHDDDSDESDDREDDSHEDDSHEDESDDSHDEDDD